MKLKITELSRKLRAGKISAAELAEEYLGKIKEENPKLNAYVRVLAEKAGEDAKRADEMLARGEGGLLCGIPYALKDNICTAGYETGCCSKMLEGHKPFYNARVIDKLEKAGAVLLGKTNMDEFAMGQTSETSAFGAPKNPANTEYVAGGSSGGSAAAVAAGLAGFSLGSDTGGSIRQPASFCGTVGFKPGYGEVSRYGLIAYGSSLDVIGPLASSVGDAAAVYDAIKENTGESALEAVKGIYEGTGRKGICGDGKKLTIGLAREFFENIQPEIAEKVMAAVKEYEKNGAQVKELSLPMLPGALPTYYIIACAEASSNLGRYDGIRYGHRAEDYKDVDDMIIRSRSEGFGAEVKKRIMLGTYVLSSGYYDAYYKKACMVRNGICREFARAFTDCDMLIAPTAPRTAFKLGDESISDTDRYMSDLETVPASIAGLPAISVPVGNDSLGLPTGMQIIGRRKDDIGVLKAAAIYEKITGLEV